MSIAIQGAGAAGHNSQPCWQLSGNHVCMYTCAAGDRIHRAGVGCSVCSRCSALRDAGDRSPHHSGLKRAPGCHAQGTCA